MSATDKSRRAFDLSRANTVHLERKQGPVALSSFTSRTLPTNYLLESLTRACGVVGYHARLALHLREGSGSIPDMSIFYHLVPSFKAQSGKRRGTLYRFFSCSLLTVTVSRTVCSVVPLREMWRTRPVDPVRTVCTGARVHSVQLELELVRPLATPQLFGSYHPLQLSVASVQANLCDGARDICEHTQ